MSSSVDDHVHTSNNPTAQSGGSAAASGSAAVSVHAAPAPAAAASASASATASASASAAAAAVTPASVLDGLKAHKEWARAVAFDSDGRVIASTFKLVDAEVDAWLKLFDKREDTIASGILLLNEQYDVHRFHPPLIYGRRGDPAVEESEGIAVCRAERKSAATPYVYCLITYTYPTLSARAAPQLRAFCETQLANLP
ncbi:hypothetical protein P43SY_007553 [Pythium insidiosum]|uniref:Profilin n=1 Tax=Pythium insidiosum TaxID=114742 RepID=A0AAD5L9M9_PYTIN|nr:hypothetical protein P43SY_007553 [Pythium insidiosum]